MQIQTKNKIIMIQSLSFNSFVNHQLYNNNLKMEVQKSKLESLLDGFAYSLSIITW